MIDPCYALTNPSHCLGFRKQDGYGKIRGFIVRSPPFLLFLLGYSLTHHLGVDRDEFRH